MNFAVAATLAAAILSAFMAAVARRLSRAPLWRDLERFWPLGAATSLFALLELGTLLKGPPWLIALIAALQLGMGLLAAYAWLRWTAVAFERTPVPHERGIALAVLAAMVLVLVPGLGLDAGQIHAHADPFLGGVWLDVRLTPFGHAVTLAGLGLAAWVVARFVRAWRGGLEGGGAMALSFSGAVLLSALDYLVRIDALTGPHVAGLGAVLPMATVTWVLGHRFVADANALESLRDRLEGLVESRTRDLAETHAALLQAEKLAALGQFAAGVAHEVNNPASVVTANLSHLSANLADLGGAEAREIVDESLDAMRRINDLVRKLLDAGRLADLPPGTGNVPLGSAVTAAVDELRPRIRGDVVVSNRVPEDLIVRGGDEVVRRILANLLANALESIPVDRRGRVEVSARAEGQSVVALIEDDGGGMGTDVLRRAFDPFFTTKPLGRGSGLGLPITRGLVEGIGGQIWLESSPGKGTRAVVELPAARPG